MLNASLFNKNGSVIKKSN